MPLAPGSRLGPYEILDSLGSGGMGEVYRARDSKLARDVAVKILPPTFLDDPDRMARFRREAQVLASLNHPHIAAIYGLEEHALVMELVEGPTLEDRLKPGPLAIEEALAIARQIAGALEYAHEKGVVHRDLKPANVKINPEGAVKVLDFGLAKVANDTAVSSDAANSPTLTMRATQAGIIMGTAGYMSPEQASAKPVDRRADIWSFGVVLWEMLTGRRLFAGETVSHTLADVLRAEIDLHRLPAATPPPIRDLLGRCLDRDVKNRLRDIGEARIAIQKYLADPAGAPATPAAQRHPLPWIAAAGIFALAAAGLAVVHFREKPPEPPRPIRFQVFPPEKYTLGDHFVVSPDGRRLAFNATSEHGQTHLWVRSLDTIESRSVAEADRSSMSSAFWSPDSRFLAFGDGGKLKKVDVAGGPPQTLCEVPDRVGSGAWNRDGVILFGGLGTGPGIRKVSAAGGSPSLVTAVDTSREEAFHTFPTFLPDGRHFIYSRLGVRDTGGAYLGSLDAKPAEQAGKRLMETRVSVVYTPAPAGAGRVLFLREQTLMAQPFDEKRLELTGEPVPLADRIGAANTVRGYFSAAGGVLAFRTGEAGTMQLTWFDRRGKELGTVGEAGYMQGPAISPDGRSVVVDSRDPVTGLADLWLHDLARGAASRFTFSARANGFAVWSPDSSRIAFFSPGGRGTGARESAGGIHQKLASGVGQEEVLDEHALMPTDWSRDGRYIIAGARDPKTKRDVWVLPVADRKAYPYLHSEFNEYGGRLSPDGRWLAYVSDETRRFEIYVQTFPTPTGKWQISTSGGDTPVWSRDGKELFFLGTDQRIMAVAVNSGGAKFESGVPRPLFVSNIGAGIHWFDVGKDGRFLIPARGSRSASAPITVVVNWTGLLKD